MGNIIDKIFEFEDKYLDDNRINFFDKNIMQEFETLSNGHIKSYFELLYRPREYRQELSKHYESLKSDIRGFQKIPEIIGNDIEPIMVVNNIFAQEYGFESHNDMLIYASKHFNGKSPISVKDLIELKNSAGTEVPKSKITELQEPFTWSEIKNLQSYNDFKNLMLNRTKSVYNDKISGLDLFDDELLENKDFILKYNEHINKLFKEYTSPYIHNYKVIHGKDIDISKAMEKTLNNLDIFHWHLEYSSSYIKHSKNPKVVSSFVTEEIDNILQWMEDPIKEVITEEADKYNRYLNPKISEYVENREAAKIFDKAIEKSNAGLPTREEVSELIAANAKLHSKKEVINHGLFAYANQFTDEIENVISNNLKNIIDNPDFEICATNEVFHLGDIGISGTGNITGALNKDMSSSIGYQGKREHGFNDIKHLLDSRSSTYAEYYANNFDIQALWVKKQFFDEHKDFVLNLAKTNNIDRIDILLQKQGRADLLDTPSYVMESINVNDAINTITEETKSLSKEIKHKKKYNVIEPKKLKQVNNVENVTKNKYRVIKPKKLKEKELIQHHKKYNVVKPKKLKTMTNKPLTSNTSSMKTKTLGGSGKLPIGIFIAGAVAGYVIHESNKDNEKRNYHTHTLPRTTNYSNIDNSYEQQLASDISSYRYGKRMTGYINA